MRIFDHTVLSRRGVPGDEVFEMLANLGADGWQIVSAYAVQEGSTAISTHYFVLCREVEAEQKPPEVKAPAVAIAGSVEAEPNSKSQKGKGR